MPPAEEIQRYLSGAWRLMMGRQDGLRMLDLTVDGFWNSFFAIIVALPALVVGWVAVANDSSLFDPGFAGRLALVIRLAIIDLGAWVLPIAVLALVARPAGIADRFVHYVVATNWASALTLWIMLPPALIRLFWPGATELVTLLSLGLFVVTLVLLWRLTNVAIGKGPAIATSVFCGMFVASLVALFVLQTLLGLSMQ
ncbi:transporter [Mesorhizobium sp. J18]|uniref:transporter n=1 Tax=Mesorhizobium sp. J18 TaxID=935263 RepID=UPI00119FC703|nr:transporter [Mesorhizobium sp. J18]